MAHTIHIDIVSAEGELYTGDATMVFAPASGGEIGIALFPRFFVEKELESGRLVQTIPDHAPPELSINAVYETRRHLLPKLQAFLGFLKERFGDGE